MYYQSKSSLLLVPAMVGLLSLALSSAAWAEKSKHRSAVGEQNNSASADDDQQDNRQRQHGESVRNEQPMEKQPSAQIVQPPRQSPERASQVELVRQNSEGQQSRQRQQQAQQSAQRASIAERIAAGESLAMQRDNADNARQNRQDRNERDDNNGRDNRNDNNDRDNNSNRRTPIVQKPYQQTDQDQWQEQQQRQANDYRRHLDGQQPSALRIVQNLRGQNRNEQYRSQQRYYDRMNQQRRHHDYGRNNNDYYRGSYHYSPVIYRYSRGGNYYYANRYQADLMRQAINYGYEEGYYAGRADRMDRWGFNYRDAYAYQDANYGYSGYYVDRGTYNYYFRQGFSRGYDDGYYSRYRYGRHDNNNYSLNDSVFRLILNFSNWR